MVLLHAAWKGRRDVQRALTLAATRRHNDLAEPELNDDVLNIKKFIKFSVGRLLEVGEDILPMLPQCSMKPAPARRSRR